MPRAFDITSAVNGLKLSDGKGEFSFTASNKLGRAVRARAVAEADNLTQKSWLTVVPPEERDFTHDGTQTFTVKIALPPSAPAGSYGFHLLLSSVTNPDEDYAHGPPVTFEHAAAAPKKPFPWWIPVTAVAVLGLAVGGFVLAKSLKGVTPGTPCSTEEQCGALTCVKRDEASVCLVKAQQPCKLSKDCAQGQCTDNLCTAVKPKAFFPCASDAECGDEMKCTNGGLTKLCLVKLDKPCTDGKECVEGSCLGGVCKIAKAGDVCAPDGLAPCPKPMICQPKDAEGKAGTCLVELDGPCGGGGECVTNTCVGGKCGLPAGTACSEHSQCPSGQRCTPLGMGAFTCRRVKGQPCSVGADCVTLSCLAEGTCSDDSAICAVDSDCPGGDRACQFNRCVLVDGQACKHDQNCRSGHCAGLPLMPKNLRCLPFNPPCSGCASGKFCSKGQCVNAPRPMFTINPHLTHELIKER
jgi:hypothetical protein